MEIYNKRPVVFEDRDEQKGVLTALNGIKKLLSSPKRWVKGELRNEQGQFCLIGAANKVDGPFESEVIELMVSSVRGISENDVMEYNDHDRRKHSDILGFLDRCISRATKGRVATSN